jgi:hypothetical protein
MRMGWCGVGGRRVSFLSEAHSIGTAIQDLVLVALVGETAKDQAVFHLLQARAGFVFSALLATCFPEMTRWVTLWMRGCGEWVLDLT